MHHNVFKRNVIDQNIIYILLDVRLFDSDSACGISLSIHVDQKNPLPQICQTCGQIDAGRRFADAAFLICNCNDSTHF